MGEHCLQNCITPYSGQFEKEGMFNINESFTDTIFRDKPGRLASKRQTSCNLEDREYLLFYNKVHVLFENLLLLHMYIPIYFHQYYWIITIITISSF